MNDMPLPKIAGYRQLDEHEIRLMNEVKREGGNLAALVNLLRELPNIDQRWVSIGETHLQQGLMALTRAVARPTSF